MHLLIIDKAATEYKEALDSKFPNLSIYAVTKQDEIGDLIEKIDILVTSRISDELIKKASNLKWIQTRTTGVDKILNLPSLRKDILITSARGIHGPQMSEMAILLMLALNRNLPRAVRNQDQMIWERWPGKLLYQKNVGILGVGVIGEEIARKCKAFKMTVLGIDLVKKKIDAIDDFYKPESLLQAVQEIDYLVIAAPYTPHTEKMVGPQVFSQMKPTAFLINIARGEIVDEKALIHALKNGQIAGAALDVFSTEPLPKAHPLWGMKNVIITSHVGGRSDIQVKQILPILEENLQLFLQGERQNLINFIIK